MRTLCKSLLDLMGDFLSLGDELLCVVLSNDGFEDFLGDGGEDSVGVVGSEVVVNLGEAFGHGSVEHSEGDVASLLVTGDGLGGEELGHGADLELDHLLDSGDPDVDALSVDTGQKTSGGVHDECALTSVHDEDELRDEEATHGEDGTEAAHPVEERFHLLSKYINYLWVQLIY